MPASSYIAGDRRQLTLAVGSSQTIAKGELLCYASSRVKNLAQLADVGTKVQNQQAARDAFIGVAMRASVSATPTTIPVATAGVFEFDCTSATYEVGDLIAPQGTGSASAVGISSTAVEATTDPSTAIGRVAKRGTTVTRVQVQIFTTLMRAPSDDTFTSDTISENTATNGVVIDSVRLKDGIVWTPQAAPTAKSTTTPTLAAADLLGELITSTNAGAVTATLDTGTAMDTAITSIVGVDTAFDWSLINLGSSSGAATVTASSGHTVVGLMVVAITTTGRFRTRRTAANTWVTYRLS